MQDQRQERERLIARVIKTLRERTSADRPEIAEEIALRTFGGLPIEELREADHATLCGVPLALHQCGSRRQAGKPEIRLFNPHPAADGWGRGHTVVAIVTDDMPFLVDSMIGELSRRELRVHLAVHPQITVRRDEEGCLVEILERGILGDGVLNESFMLFEIDVRSSQAALDELAEAFLRILGDVRAAVEDWPGMRVAVRRVLAELDASPPPLPRDEIDEAREFLLWVEDDHYTFLGYVEHGLEQDGEDHSLTPDRGSALGLYRKLPVDTLSTGARLFDDESLIRISKSTHRSTVHRTVHMDLLEIKRFAAGRPVGEYRFLGLFSSLAYSITASRIPLIRRKVRRVLERADFLPASHDAKGFRHIVENYPRDELFQISEAELYRFARLLLEIQLRPRLALLLRRDDHDRFISCIVMVRRERHSTRLRLQMQSILEKAFHGKVIAYDTRISDDPLAMVRFIVQVTPGRIPDYDEEEIRRRLVEVARTWSDRLRSRLVAEHGEEEGLRQWRLFGEAFPVSYQEHFAIDTAIDDIPAIERVRAEVRRGLRLSHREGAAVSRFHFRTYELAVPTPLSDLVPMIENNGLQVVSEIPFEVRPAGATNPVWVRDFEVVADREVDLDETRELFEEAFLKVWNGAVDNDGFNRLVLRARLTWREVDLLRAYSRYLWQISTAFSHRHMEQTLGRHPRVARLLIDLVTARLDPDRGCAETASRVAGEIRSEIEGVRDRDEDRILRRYLNLISSTVRSNYFQHREGEDGRPVGPKAHISLKFDCAAIEALPQPRPKFEVFVFSREVEGVHLRGGKVARGGIRWSDRRQDYRTEILGLVKSQMVKNAVIVPVGAKGGFVVKEPVRSQDREEIQAQGMACYRTFIRGLLDITDNLVGQNVVPPPRVVRRDGDDPYLVVAADKGTATFSDLANHVAEEYSFWLGDAFASGGSVGYDHKKMGITARGGWESVKRHFRELGQDIQNQPFTVVGVGDMSGDVFGNAMLLSEHLRLVAAFNHLHIFLDPDPDPAASFAERRRLFDLPRSTWKDYDPSCLSTGAGIYERQAKSLTVSPEAQQVLGLSSPTVTPQELIRAILCAKVDLLWLGGIGTYVKATRETHADTGDRTNDDVRVDAGGLRARVVGEGANLGLTQAARIEFALGGGAINTDFIDNSGGVDCSDHEVNIKIALRDAVHAGELTLQERNELLEQMEDEVGRLVLHDNYLQSQSITLARHQGAAILDEQARLIAELERSGQLDRRLEGLPDHSTLADRRAANRGLTRPEVAVLLAYSKIHVYNELLDSELPDEALLAHDLMLYFPVPMRERFLRAIEGHGLRREIIATHVTNSITNRVGPTFVPRMAEETGSTVSEVARAYTAARDLFELRSLWEEIERLDNQVPADLQIRMTLDSVAFVERTTRWFLRYGGRPLRLAALLARYEADILIVAAQLEDMLSASSRARLRRRCRRFDDLGVPIELAERIASLPTLPASCDVARCAVESGVGVERVGKIYFAVGESFGIERLLRASETLRGESPWLQTAVASISDDLLGHQAELARQIATGSDDKAKVAIESFAQSNPLDMARLRNLLKDFETAHRVDLAMLTVAERELRRLLEE